MLFAKVGQTMHQSPALCTFHLGPRASLKGSPSGRNSFVHVCFIASADLGDQLLGRWIERLQSLPRDGVNVFVVDKGLRTKLDRFAIGRFEVFRFALERGE